MEGFLTTLQYPKTEAFFFTASQVKGIKTHFPGAFKNLKKNQHTRKKSSQNPETSPICSSHSRKLATWKRKGKKSMTSISTFSND